MVKISKVNTINCKRR